MTPEQLAALGVEPIAYFQADEHGSIEHVSEIYNGDSDVFPLYTHSDLLKVCAAYESRVVELEGALHGLHSVCQLALSAKDGSQYANFESRHGTFVHAATAMKSAEDSLSQSSPLTALEEYRKKVLMEAAADVKLLRPSLTPLGIALEIEGMAEEAGK